MQASTIAPICFLFAIFCAWSGCRVPHEAAELEARRVPISLRELRFEAENMFKEWKLQDFHFCSNYVTSVDDTGIDAWVPIYPVTDDGDDIVPADCDVRDVVHIWAYTRDEIREVLTRDELNVLVCGESVFDEAALKSLQRIHYPGLQPDLCRVITKKSGYFAYENPGETSLDAFLMSALFVFVGLTVCGLEVIVRHRSALPRAKEEFLASIDHEDTRANSTSDAR